MRKAVCCMNDPINSRRGHSNAGLVRGFRGRSLLLSKNVLILHLILKMRCAALRQTKPALRQVHAKFRCAFR